MKEQTKPTRKPISLSIDANGDITISPTVTYLDHRNRDGVEWKVAKGGKIARFSIMFPDRTPFSRVTFTGNPEEAAPSGGVREGAELGSYHYTIAFDSELGIKQVPGCPEIIIE